MATKRGLGRGLNALIPDYTPTDDEMKGAREIKLIDIEPNKSQPRKKFDKEKLEALSESIRQHGVIQPILVRKNGELYEIIAGERRWRAAKLAGLKQIPAVVSDLEGSQIMEVALIENLQREDLNPMEEARGYKALMEEFNFTQEEISVKVSKSRSSIANCLRFLNLVPDVQTLLENGDITEGHAKVILSLSPKMQFDLAKRVIDENLTVRDCEKIANTLNRKKRPSNPTNEEIKRYLSSIEENVSKIIGSKVHIITGKKKGKIEIEYYNDEDFERILAILKGDSLSSDQSVI